MTVEKDDVVARETGVVRSLALVWSRALGRPGVCKSCHTDLRVLNLEQRTEIEG